MRRFVLVSSLCAGLTLAVAGPAGAQINLTPESANFGKVKAKTQSAPIVFTLSSGPFGGSSTYANQPRTTGPWFKIVSNTCPSQLPTNSSCTISVVFAPTASLPKSEYLIVSPPFSESPNQSLMGGEGISASKGKGKKCKKGKKGAAAAKKKRCKKK